MTELPYKVRQMASGKASAKHEAEEQMIFDYADALMANAEAHAIVTDEAALPHPKQELLQALLSKIARDPDREVVRALSIAALSLADYQPGVGANPLFSATDDQIAGMRENRRDVLLEVANNYEKISRFNADISKDMKFIFGLIESAKQRNYHLQPLYVRSWRLLKSCVSRRDIKRI